MIQVVLKQNKNKKMPNAYGLYYAYPVVNETYDLDKLAEHMSSHNTPFSKGAIKGMLTDAVNCIRELNLQGIAVKITDLAIFSLGIKNIHIGPTLPAFVSPNVLKVLVEKFGLGSISTVEEDLKSMQLTE